MLTSTNGRNYVTSKGCNLAAPLDLSQDCFPLQAVSVLHEGASAEAEDELSPPASRQAGPVLLCPAPPGEQRFAEEVTHVCVSAGGDTTTEKQKGEVNAVGSPVLSSKHSVCKHAADLLCPSPEDDACIPQGQGIAL